MFQKRNKYLCNIPVFLIWECLLLRLVCYTDWYAKNSELIKSINNLVVFISLIHFMCYTELYNRMQLLYFFCVSFLVFLQFIYYDIPEKLYFFLYLLLVLFPIIISTIQWLTISKTKDSTK